jgi:hypothetical protein
MVFFTYKILKYEPICYFLYNIYTSFFLLVTRAQLAEVDLCWSGRVDSLLHGLVRLGRFSFSYLLMGFSLLHVVFKCSYHCLLGTHENLLFKFFEGVASRITCLWYRGITYTYLTAD